MKTLEAMSTEQELACRCSNLIFHSFELVAADVASAKSLSHLVAQVVSLCNKSLDCYIRPDVDLIQILAPKRIPAAIRMDEAVADLF